MSDDDSTDERKAKESARNKAWREANKEYLKAYNEARRAENAAKTRAYRARHPERITAYRERTKPQIAVYHAVYYEANKERIAARGKVHYAENKDVIRAKQKATYDPVKQKFRGLKCRYGLTAERYEEMLQECKGRCEVCKAPFSEITKDRPFVDHCHKTGKVRGLICLRCNAALGHAGDDPKILRALARYVERYRG
jgi:hypothetical protein